MVISISCRLVMGVREVIIDVATAIKYHCDLVRMDAESLTISEHLQRVIAPSLLIISLANRSVKILISGIPGHR